MRARRSCSRRLPDAQPDQADIARKALSEAHRRRPNGPCAAACRERSRPPSCRPTRGCCWSRTRCSGAMPIARCRGSTASGDNGDLIVPDAADQGMGLRPSVAMPTGALATHRPDSGQQPARLRCGARSSALILLKFRRTAEAEPFARQRDRRSGRARNSPAACTRRRVPCCRRPGARAGRWSRAWARRPARRGSGSCAGKRAGEAIDKPPEALSEVLTAFAADLARVQRVCAAGRPGPGRALRRSAEQQRDDAAGAPARRAGAHRRSARAAAGDPADDALIAASPRRPGRAS